MDASSYLVLVTPKRKITIDFHLIGRNERRHGLGRTDKHALCHGTSALAHTALSYLAYRIEKEKILRAQVPIVQLTV